VTQRLYADPTTSVHALLSARATPRTRALYLATPNNPDGKVLPRAVLEEVARFARERELWVLADEVYEDIVFTGEHVSIAALDGMAERTITAMSLSKSYGLAGLRLGCVVADPKIMHALRKMVNHAVYNVPVVLQRVGLGAVENSDEWLAGARAAYREARDLASAEVPAPHFLPEGGAYLFLDLAPFAGAAGEPAIQALHERLLDAGVALAPGAAFGARHAMHARLCYTALEGERLRAGLRRLREVLEAAKATRDL
jgi:aspartate/methionine/tyrosine aminotransferase